jgi:hypothetical protein
MKWCPKPIIDIIIKYASYPILIAVDGTTNVCFYLTFAQQIHSFSCCSLYLVIVRWGNDAMEIICLSDPISYITDSSMKKSSLREAATVRKALNDGTRICEWQSGLPIIADKDKNQLV